MHIMASYLLLFFRGRLSVDHCLQVFKQEKCGMKKNGFTLIEIIIVTAIIGLLATLASVGIVKGRNESRIKEAKVELNMISTAVLQLAWDTGKWPNGRIRTSPGSAEVWDLTGADAGLLAVNETKYPGGKGPYLDAIELDPWGNPYFFDPDFRIDGVMRIVVGSFGPNGSGKNLYDSDDIYIRLDD
jgi:general secretion pathway protein G